ncbi:glycosyltransferase [Clostridium bornimense]|uniref:glycosyltransferase n=1 Tax=Clostridium bornimense TaxID=1216932 RepID=UPI001C11D5F4|nr:glycosyltransferase [Clostridium bornimense]MBU5317706.1 glycosyltransferase [Clostridium bornimense]
MKVKEKIKVCHVINCFENGGVESFLITYFNNMDLSNYDLHIVAHCIKVPECMSKFEKLGFKIHIIPSKKNIVGHLKGLNQVFSTENFDIIHIATTEWAFIPAIIGKINNCKHIINHSHMAENFNSIVWKIIYKFIAELGVLFSTDYFACSKDAAICLFGKNRVEKNEVTIIKNAISINNFMFNEKVRMDKRNELDIKHDYWCIGHVGRFCEQKNQLFLLQVFKKIVKLKNNVKFILVGVGPLENECKALANELGISENILFLGARNDVNDLYQAMDVFVFPSLYEGLGIVAIEAQTSGLPVIASDKIPGEVKITNLLTFVSLDATPDKWAKIILENCKRSNRSTDFSCIESNGYNIKIEANKLDEKYKSIIETKY